jgi:hypothetical protein
MEGLLVKLEMQNKQNVDPELLRNLDMLMEMDMLENEEDMSMIEENENEEMNDEST